MATFLLQISAISYQGWWGPGFSSGHWYGGRGQVMYMRKLVGLVTGLLISGSVAGLELFLPLPSYIQGGIPSFEKWLESRKPEFFTFTERVELKPAGSLFAVYRSVGSGAYVLDAYIYGCNEANCSLIGMRKGIGGLSYDTGQPLMMKFAKGRGEVRVVDAKGKVYLLISDLR